MTDSEVPVSFIERVEESTEYKGLVERGITARKAGDLSNWELGDLAIAAVVEAKRQFQAAEHGDEATAGHYGKQVLRRYAEAIGVEYQALRNYHWVSGRYENVLRKTFSKLSWSHFWAVAERPDREELLEKAQGGDWSVRALSDEVARQAGKETSEERDLDRVLDMRNKTPYEALCEIMRLTEGHIADRGMRATIESFNKEETLPILRARAVERAAGMIKFWYQIHKEMS